MPAQSSISSLMSLSPRTDAARPRSGSADERFSRLMESSTQTGAPAARNRAEAGNLRDAHAARDTRTASTDGDRSGDRRGNNGATVGNGGSAEHGRRADGRENTGRAEIPRTGEGERASKGADAAQGIVEAADAESAIEQARSLLAELSDEEWSQLTEDVKAVLQDLKTQVDAGQLDPSLEASLRELLADLEAGSPLDSIMQQLQAIPLDQLPSLAARFPDARTLGDVVGKRGAAYLTQLSAMAGNTTATAQSPVTEATATQTLASAGDSGKPDLSALLEASKQGVRTPRQEFGLLMSELANAQPGSPKPVDLGASATAASSTAQLESAARTQPLAAADRQFTVQSEVRVPVGQSQWGQAVGQRVMWMASQKLSSAELRLDPPDLGPMQVRVSSHQDQISVTFTSAQPAVREALDQNATRLREMFAEQGLDLVDVNVSDQSGGDASGESGEDGGGRGGHHSEEPGGPVVEQVISDRLVDHYA